MKKRLYIGVFAMLTAFFLFSILVLSLIYNINIFDSKFGLMLILLNIFLINPILTNYFAKYIFKMSMKPLNKYIGYISKIILNDPEIKKMSNVEEHDIIEIVEEYGYNSKEIKEGLERLRESSKIRKEFSANVSHELKSPLTSINGFAEMIATGMASGEEARNFAKKINNEGNRLLKMIDETILLSKIDSNHIKINRLEKFDISYIILDNIEAMSIVAKEKNVKIYYEQESIEFFGHHGLFYDMVHNLISNAIKYSKEKNAELKIIVKENKKNIILTFSDNGIGISKEDQSRIFERFYVVDKSRGNKTGTGLGLSLVKNIVEFHKGKLYLESELDKGSKFIIELPKLELHDYQ